MSNRRDDRNYGKGYQAAMRDIRDAYDRGGEEAVQQWISDNLIDRQEVTS